MSNKRERDFFLQVFVFLSITLGDMMDLTRISLFTHTASARHARVDAAESVIKIRSLVT